jgi:predicted DNA-binding transcriptional regulator AlpA
MAGSAPETLLTPAEAAAFLKVSLSWLAKARQRGEGPPYAKLGRSVRYSPSVLVAWLKSNQR